jgi:tetratricopeptide (TPR) repeat protein
MYASRGWSFLTCKIRLEFLSVRLFWPIVVAIIFSLLAPQLSVSLPQQEPGTIEGTVLDSAGQPVTAAVVRLTQPNSSFEAESKTKDDGTFLFSGIFPGVYSLSAKKEGWREAAVDTISLRRGETKHLDMVLQSKKAVAGDSPATDLAKRSPMGSMEFEDEPSFTVAGVTDWSNVGLHGSGTDVRTSETLAKETLGLKPVGSSKVVSGGAAGRREAELRKAVRNSPDSFEANHQLGEFYCRQKKYDLAIPLLEAGERLEKSNLDNSYELGLSYAGVHDWDRSRKQIQKILAEKNSPETHRMAGDIYEQLGDPTNAVREFEDATRMDGSEENYFAWGSELLVHRAAEPAVEVFTKGSNLHPDSARMLTGLGAAFYATRAYEDAAKMLCKAADLQPQDPTPFIFLGGIERASTQPFPCSEERLAEFAKAQPEDAIANYYYGLILWKRAKVSDNKPELHRAQALLEKAVTIDPKLDEAYLQLGIVHADGGEFADAISSYKKAIELNSKFGEAHYRLGQVYKRMGEESKAQREIQIYKEIEKEEQEAMEKELREHLQLLVTPRDRPTEVPPR